MMASPVLLNTRPGQQAELLQSLLQQHGLTSLMAPTFEIQTFSQPPVLRQPLERYDEVIFISVNAVQAFLAQHTCQALSKSRIYAIGQATFKALESAGFNVVPPQGAQFDSEALLEHPNLKSLTGHHVLLVKGENGRELLANALTERGAKVEPWSLYRRQPLPVSESVWSAFSASEKPLVLASSQFSLECLLATTDSSAFASLEWLTSQPLIAFSQRIADWARAQDWKGMIYVVTTQSNQGVLDCIQTAFSEIIDSNADS